MYFTDKAANTGHQRRNLHLEYWISRNDGSGAEGIGPIRVDDLSRALRFQVRTVKSRYIAAQPKMMFGAHAAKDGAINPPAPTAANTLIAIQ